MRLFFYGFLIALFLFRPAGYAQEKQPQLQLSRKDTVQGTVPYFKRRFGEKKGQVRLVMGFPWRNRFYVHPIGQSAGTYSGYGGFCLGTEYFYTPRRYLSATANFALSAPAFFPLATDITREYSVATATIALSDNIQLNRWSLGWGLQYTNSTWTHHFGSRFDTGNVAPSVYRNENTLGGIGTVHYQLGKAFFAGIIYRPGFVRLGPEPGLLYQHAISLDFSIKIGLRTKL